MNMLTKPYLMEVVYTGSATEQLRHSHMFYCSIPILLEKQSLSILRDHLKICGKITDLVTSIANSKSLLINYLHGTLKEKKPSTSVISALFIIIHKRRTNPFII